MLLITSVQDNKHHPSDVIAGGILGAVTGSIFFYTSYGEGEGAQGIALDVK
jgi:membrane-associated phospholipid phosphatase